MRKLWRRVRRWLGLGEPATAPSPEPAASWKYATSSVVITAEDIKNPKTAEQFVEEKLQGELKAWKKAMPTWAEKREARMDEKRWREEIHG